MIKERGDGHVIQVQWRVSFRDEIGTHDMGSRNRCYDKLPYYEEDKTILDKEMKRICYLGIFKEGFSAHLSLVILISRKITKVKRVVTDFRHLNVRTAFHLLTLSENS